MLLEMHVPYTVRCLWDAVWLGKMCCDFSFLLTVPNHANYEIKAVVYQVFIPKMLMLPLRLASSHCIVIPGKKAVVVACMGCVCVLWCVHMAVCLCVCLCTISASVMKSCAYIHVDNSC